MSAPIKEEELDNNMLPNPSADERRQTIPSTNLIRDIGRRGFEPLLDEEEVKEDEKLLSAAIAERSPTLLTAREHLTGDLGDRSNRDQHIVTHNLEKSLLDLHLARYNEITEDLVEFFDSIYADSYPWYEDTKKSIAEYPEDCTNESLRCLLRHVNTIRSRIDEQYGYHTFTNSTKEHGRVLFGHVFDRHPVWIMSRLKSKESNTVDFASIWAYENKGRSAWRLFYRNMYIDMMAHTCEWRLCGGYKAVVVGYWKQWVKQTKVQNWGIEDAYELPVLSKLVTMGLLYLGDPEEGSGDFVAPN